MLSHFIHSLSTEVHKIRERNEGDHDRVRSVFTIFFWTIIRRDVRYERGSFGDVHRVQVDDSDRDFNRRLYVPRQEVSEHEERIRNVRYNRRRRVVRAWRYSER